MTTEAFVTHTPILSVGHNNNNSNILQLPSHCVHVLRAHYNAMMDSLEDATKLLAEWDRSLTQNSHTDPNSGLVMDGMTPNRMELKQAVWSLNEAAQAERQLDSTRGQCLLGICASSAQEGVATLKSWVTTLQLPRGLLHGMDKDGVPLEFNGAVYIKYNSGGVFTFADIRKSGLGFDSLWKPGDALLEEYDGSYRGVYFQVQLQDGEFRQYFMPMNLFEEDV